MPFIYWNWGDELPKKAPPKNPEPDAAPEPPEEEKPDPEAEEHIRVAAFNCRQFEKLGFGSVGAMLLVAAGADWHDAQRLLSQGCPPDLAMQILL